MKLFLDIRLALCASLLLATTACTSNNPSPETSASPEAGIESTVDPDMPEESGSADVAQSNLLTYNETANGIPVIAQYPDTMEVFGSGSGEGVGVHFSFKPQGNALDDAEIHVYLPFGASIVADQLPFVTGPNGLMESNGWIMEGDPQDGSDDFPYDWVKTVIAFSTDQEQSGYILLGESGGQVIQVSLLYPSEMADAYWSSARPVLDTLEFDDSLLPITPAEEGE